MQIDTGFINYIESLVNMHRIAGLDGFTVRISKSRGPNYDSINTHSKLLNKWHSGWVEGQLDNQYLHVFLIDKSSTGTLLKNPKRNNVVKKAVSFSFSCTVRGLVLTRREEKILKRTRYDKFDMKSFDTGLEKAQFQDLFYRRGYAAKPALCYPPIMRQGEMILEHEQVKYDCDFSNYQSSHSNRTKLILLKPILSALICMRKEGYVHGDVKAENVLLQNIRNASKIRALLNDHEFCSLIGAELPAINPKYKIWDCIANNFCRLTPLCDVWAAAIMLFSSMLGSGFSTVFNKNDKITINIVTRFFSQHMQNLLPAKRSRIILRPEEVLDYFLELKNPSYEIKFYLKIYIFFKNLLAQQDFINDWCTKNSDILKGYDILSVQEKADLLHQIESHHYSMEDLLGLADELLVLERSRAEQSTTAAAAAALPSK